MRLGFLTACFRETPFDEIVRWAGPAGFAALEVWCDYDEDAPLFVNRGLNLARLDEEGVRAVRGLTGANGLELSCLTRCVNLLDADPETREANVALVRRLIAAAVALNVDVVSTFVGRDLTRPIRDHMPLVEEILGPLCSDAAARGVRIAIENCPLVGGPAGDQVQNIAMAPPVFRALFEAVPDLGLNFDPSHLYWLGVDYVAAVKEFGPRIYHVHLKDTEVFDNVVADGGILGPLNRWWRYRVPGLGSLNWPAFLSALEEVGYTGALSFEHEDPVFTGSVEKIQKGLLLGKRMIEPMLP